MSGPPLGFICIYSLRIRKWLLFTRCLLQILSRRRCGRAFAANEYGRHPQAILPFMLMMNNSIPRNECYGWRKRLRSEQEDGFAADTRWIRDGSGLAPRLNKMDSELNVPPDRLQHRKSVKARGRSMGSGSRSPQPRLLDSAGGGPTRAFSPSEACPLNPPPPPPDFSRYPRHPTGSRNSAANM